MKQFFISGIILLLVSCSPQLTSTPNPPIQKANIATVTATATTAPLPRPQYTPTPQSISAPVHLGPDEFPQDYNPLTGQRVEDPSLLKIPALLISVSHFPSVARPQAGLSFAPFVYEYFITEGATRHLAAFYGEAPEPEIPLHGDCEIRNEPFAKTDNILGNRVWYDENQNGIQDPGEGGIGGICVNLYDANDHLLQQTTTDSNGYYAFNVSAGKYILEFMKPAWLDFTQKNVGDENQDSDVDQETGRTDAVDVESSLLLLDAGLVPSKDIVPTPDVIYPTPRRGSGTRPFGQIGLQISRKPLSKQLPDLRLR